MRLGFIMCGETDRIVIKELGAEITSLRDDQRATQGHARSWEVGREAAAKVADYRANVWRRGERGACSMSLEEECEDIAASIRALRPPAGSGGAHDQRKHPSHKTRSSDSSFYDEVCTVCGATDETGNGWGKLAEPCKSPTPSPDERAKLADWFAELKPTCNDFCSASPHPHVHVHMAFDLHSRDLIVAALRTTPAPAVSEEEVARKLAYLEWPFATAMESQDWAEKRWERYLPNARAILALFNPTPSTADRGSR